MAGLTRRRGAAGAAVLTLALASAFIAGCDRAPGAGPAFKAIDVSGADFGRELALPDAEGRPRSLADFRGKVTVIFFGYAQCPDVCPTTLAELAEARRALGRAGQDVQGVFVTVDPERDTPEMLKAYVASFDPSFVALRGSPEQTREAAKAFKIFYARVPGKTEGSYTVDHTAGAYVLDREARLRLFTRHGTGAEALVHDLKLLLGGA
ncbi:MAG: SCO family protein [Burkholderiaceae bacterium]|jgi:protein SCO1/2|nr:SCO family protein [Burkholderiaceae bacterium]MCP5289635.1 SCO family protein [Burkholderiaceae bacterium]